jgi:hypothetical protein
MARFEPGRSGSRRDGVRRRAVAAALAAALLAGPAGAGPPPPPDSDRPRPPAYEPPPVAVPPPPGAILVPEPPPPLPIGLRILYAPFYVTGLVLRYGFYYALVVPLEVLGRTLTYGAEGGVERDHAER